MDDYDLNTARCVVVSFILYWNDVALGMRVSSFHLYVFMYLIDRSDKCSIKLLI